MAKKEELTPNSSVVVDGIEIKTYKREITSCNIIEVEVGTTGHMGGDAGHGGRTYLKIRNLSSTDMRPKAYSDDYGHNHVEIVLGGDTELDTFYEALCFAAEVLGHDLVQHAVELGHVHAVHRRLDASFHVQLLDD